MTLLLDILLDAYALIVGTALLLLLTCLLTAIVVSPILLYEAIIERLGK